MAVAEPYNHQQEKEDTNEAYYEEKPGDFSPGFFCFW